MADTVHELYSTWDSQIILAPSSWIVRLIIFNRHLNCFLIFTITNCTAMNIPRLPSHVSQCKCARISLGVGLMNHGVFLLLFFNFKMVIPIYNPTHSLKYSSCFIFSPTLLIVRVFYFCQSHGWGDMVLHYDLIRISLTTEVEPFFNRLICYSAFSFCEMPVQVFAHFSMNFFSNWYVEVTYISWILTFCQFFQLQMSSPSLCLVFSLFVLSLVNRNS